MLLPFKESVTLFPIYSLNYSNSIFFFKGTGARLGMFFQAVSSLGVGIIIGFVYSWKMTLLVLGCMPLLLIGAMLEMRLTKGFSGENNAALDKAGKVRSPKDYVKINFKETYKIFCRLLQKLYQISEQLLYYAKKNISLKYIMTVYMAPTSKTSKYFHENE